MRSEIAIVAFSNYVESSFPEEAWAPALRKNPGKLGDRDVALFALHVVNTLGWWQADHWRVKLPDAKPPWPVQR